jgi:hypothetical protein
MRIDQLIAFVAISSIFVVYYSSEWFYNNDNESNTEVLVMRLINMSLSICLGYLLYRHHLL